MLGACRSGPLYPEPGDRIPEQALELVGAVGMALDDDTIGSAAACRLQCHGGVDTLGRRTHHPRADHPYPSKAYTAVRRPRDGAARAARETECKAGGPNTGALQTQQIREDDMTRRTSGRWTDSSLHGGSQAACTARSG
jgi:hypothetical protein